MSPPPIPGHLAHLPVVRGLPVPHVAAWSSEGHSVIRYDPVVQRHAVFARGRQGRGRPLFGLFSAERQRHAVIGALCQICSVKLDEGGAWLPAHDRLIDGYNAGRPMFLEPPCCEPCARYAAQACLGIAGRFAGLLNIFEYEPVIQLIDPGAGPLRGAERFDSTDSPADLARLSSIALRHRGVAGHCKYVINDYDPRPIMIASS